jgi:hypothetical protein
MKDSGEVMKFSSIYEMQKYVEAIDIENHEYLAWDAEGKTLGLSTQKPVWIKIEEGSNDVRSLAGALRAFAASRGVQTSESPSSPAELEALFESIAKRKHQSGT